MASYYRRYIQGFADVTAPLHEVTKGGAGRFTWTVEAEHAFQTLKRLLCTSPILAMPDFTLPFILYTDASDKELGDILSQNVNGQDAAVAYASLSLTSAKKNYSTTEKECLAIVWAVTLWRPHLLRKTFLIVTDHQCLTWLQTIKEPKGRLARRILAIQEYAFEIRHRPGKQNTNAGALSRSPALSEPPAIQEVIDDEMTIGVGTTRIDRRWQPSELRTMHQRDGEISQVVDQLKRSNIRPELAGKWSENGILRRYRQLWTQLEMVDGILHRNVEGARLLLVPITDT